MEILVLCVKEDINCREIIGVNCAGIEMTGARWESISMIIGVHVTLALRVY